MLKRLLFAVLLLCAFAAQAAVYSLPWGPKPQFVDANGAPMSGGSISTFAAGSSTTQVTYTDSTGKVANPTTISLNVRGETPNEVWLTGGLSYKLVLKDSGGATVWTVDNVAGVNDPSVAVQDEWKASGIVPTYVSATSLTFPGDQTVTFHAGRRIKTTNSGGTIYSSILTSTFAVNTTTITVVNDSGTLDAGLSAVSYGLVAYTNTSLPAFRPTGTGASSRLMRDKELDFINAKDFGAKCDGVTDDATAINNALNAYNVVELPDGTCLVNSAIAIANAKTLEGRGRTTTTIKAGTVGITVLNLADPTFNVRIRHLNIDGNSKALYGIASAGAATAAHMIIEDVSVSGATSKNIYLKNMYYSDLISVYASGGASYGLHLESSGNNNIIGGLYYNHSTASIALTAGATLNRFMGFRTYNDVTTASPQLLFIDSSYGNVFIGGHFEPQGANNVTNNVTLTKTGASNCTDNQFLYNSFIGVPNTASGNVIQIGSGGACTKTQLVGNRFIKPTAANSVRLTTQTSTVLRDNVDLVTYDTAVYTQVTVTNTSGNPYEITGLDGTFTTVNASGAVTVGTQLNVTGTNVNLQKGTGDQIKIAGSGGDIVQFDNNRSVTWPGVPIASLPVATNGTIMYCSDCVIANPCAGAGTGAIAKRLAGAWVCN